MARVFVTGGTGYVGAALLPLLIERGHTVRALARQESIERLPSTCEPVIGDALDSGTFARAVPPSDTLVHLIGTAHPAPWKGEQFRRVDGPSLSASLEASLQAGVGHLVYVSVAHPAPVMKEYIAVRSECEDRIRHSGIHATILRPWYVLGPGHRWPYVLVPLYAIGRALPLTREGATRLGLVTHKQMIRAIVWAVENPPQSLRIIEVPGIRRVSLSEGAAAQD